MKFIWHLKRILNILCFRLFVNVFVLVKKKKKEKKRKKKKTKKKEGISFFASVSLSFLYSTISELEILALLGYFLGSAHGSHQKKTFTLKKSVRLRNGTNFISLLSVMVGLPVIFNLISLILSINQGN